jgi:hypothetical protein
MTRPLQVSQTVFRVVVAATLSDLIPSIFWQKYSHWIANIRGSEIITWSMIALSFLLPLFVLVEALFLRHDKITIKGIWIDALLAAAYFLLFWGSVLYAFTHDAII